MKRILLADDDKSLNRSVDILLTLDGYQTMSVYNGEEALQKLLQQKLKPIHWFQLMEEMHILLLLVPMV